MKAKYRLVLPVSVAAFVFFSLAVGAGLLGPFDAWMLDLAQRYPSGILDEVGLITSLVGSVEFVAIAALVLAAVLFASGRRDLALRLLVAFVITALVEVACKMVLPQAPLPAVVMRGPDPSLLDLSTPYPYPSGHMLRSVLLLGALYALWTNKAGRSAILIFLLAAAFCRIYLGTHWPSDVVGGVLLGIAGLAWAFGNVGPSKT